MDLILTMAGKYSRFAETGYNIPKYLLPFGDRSILSEILNQFRQQKHPGSSPPRQFGFRVHLVANKSDERFMGHVRRIMSAHGINHDSLILIDDTTGQAETALKAIEIINPPGPVLFHNIDTILYGRDLIEIEQALQRCNGYIDVFRSHNHSYSYVVADDLGKVELISEKVLVSDLATSGLYGFYTSRYFKIFYESGMMYISEIYQKMIEDGMDIRTGPVHDEKDTLVLGSPEDYFKISETL